MTDHRGCTHNLSSCEIKAWKKHKGLNGTRTYDLCDTGAVLHKLSYQAIWEPVTLCARNIPEEAGRCKWIYERSYIWTTPSSPRSWARARSGQTFFQALISQLRKLCVQLWWSITNSYLSPQFKYVISHIFICILHLLWVYITNTQRDWLPDGLIAQLVEHCTGIAEVMGWNPILAWFFFRFKFHHCWSCVYNHDD